MSTIVVRASDSALAMDEVIRRLGPDALILSTKTKNGQVEIKASLDAPKPKPKFKPPLRVVEDTPVLIEATQAVAEVPVAPTEELTFADVLAQRQKQIDVVNVAAAFAPAEGPAHRQGSTAWFGQTPEFLRELRGEIATGFSDPQGRISRLAKSLVIDQSQQATNTFLRTLIVGPSGAGKSLLAARLAGERLSRTEPQSARLVVPSRSTQLFPDRLAGQARLMGLTTERPLLRDAILDAKWRETPTTPQIFDLSEVSDLTADELAALIIPGQTEVILALPVGMHPALLAQTIAPWKAFSPRVALTRTDSFCPTPEELMAIAANGLCVGPVSVRTGIAGAVSCATREMIVDWAVSWLQGPFATQVAR